MSDFDQRRPHDDGDFHDLADPFAPDHVEARVAAVVGAAPMASVPADAPDDASDRLLRALTSAYAPPADMEAALARVYARLPLDPFVSDRDSGSGRGDATIIPLPGGTLPGDEPDIPRRPRPARRSGALETFLRVAAAAILVALLGGGFYTLFRLQARRTTVVPSATPTIVPTVTPLPSPTPRPTPSPTPTHVGGSGPDPSWPPVEANDIVYVSMSNGVLDAFDASDGTPLWRYQAAKAGAGPVTVANGVVYLAAVDPPPPGYHYSIPYLIALDASMGKQLWRVTIQNPVAGPIIVRNGALYLGTAESYVLALRASDGHQIWSFSTGGCASGAIATDGTNLYINAVYCAGLLAVRLSDGKFLWRSTVDSPGLAVGTNGVVYTSACAVSAASGARLWCLPRSLQLVSPNTRTMVLLGTVLYMSIGSRLYAPRASSGAVIFSVSCPANCEILDSGGGALYLAATGPAPTPSGPNLYAQRTSNGSALWHAAASAASQLYGLAPATGGVRWHVPIPH